MEHDAKAWGESSPAARLEAAKRIEIVALEARKRAEKLEELADGYRTGQFGEENATTSRAIEETAERIEKEARFEDEIAAALTGALGELPLETGDEAEAIVEAINDLRETLIDAGEELEFVDLVISVAKRDRVQRRRLLFELLRDEARRWPAQEVEAPDELVRAGAELFAGSFRGVRAGAAFAALEAARETLEESGFDVNEDAGIEELLSALVEACRRAGVEEFPGVRACPTGLDLDTIIRRARAFRVAGVNAPGRDRSELQAIGRSIVTEGLAGPVLVGMISTAHFGRYRVELDETILEGSVGVNVEEWREEMKLEEDEETDGELLAGASLLLEGTPGGRMLLRRLSEFALEYGDADKADVRGYLLNESILERFFRLDEVDLVPMRLDFAREMGGDDWREMIDGTTPKPEAFSCKLGGRFWIVLTLEGLDGRVYAAKELPSFVSRFLRETERRILYGNGDGSEPVGIFGAGPGPNGGAVFFDEFAPLPDPLPKLDPALEIDADGKVTIREVSLVGGQGQPDADPLGLLDTVEGDDGDGA